MGDLEYDDFRKDVLEKTNKYRALHSAEPLILDNEMNTFAQEWATTLAKNDNVERRPKDTQKFGENVFVAANINENCAVKAWYEEFHNFDWNNMEKQATLQFTQLVWVASKKLGVGIARSESGKWYIVCNYDPRGNILVKFPENVRLRLPEVDFVAYRKDLLERTNGLRATYHADPLILVDEINVLAQNWAETLAKKDKMEPNEKLETYGENIVAFNDIKTDPLILAFRQSSTIDWKNIEEVEALHFTQLIWRSSEKLGIGLAKGKKNYYVVMYFAPRGNIKGMFDENVKPKVLTEPLKPIKEVFDIEAYRKENLEKLNGYRALHSADPLVLDDTLNTKAQEWADQCAKNNVLDRSSDDYGQTVHTVTYIKTDVLQPSYDEVKTVNWEDIENSGALTFTQFVWKESKKLGIGVGKNNTSYFIVLYYDPPGNFSGCFKENVSPRKE